MTASASEQGTVTGHKELLNATRKFLTGFGYGNNVQENGGGSPGSNVGDGTITGIEGTLTTVDEVIQCNFNGTNWNVSGSVTGSMGTATTGVQFSHANIVFTITGGSPSYVSGDSFTFDAYQGKMAASGIAYTQERWTTSGESELILQAPGISGSDNIYFGWKTFEGTDALGNYFNWQCNGFSGFNSGLDFGSQPGAIDLDENVNLALWDSSIPYWIEANGQRCVIVAKVSTTYHVAYAGFFDPGGTPGQYAYPLFIGGSNCYLNNEYRWSSIYNSCFPDPYAKGSGKTTGATAAIRLPDGTWQNVANNYGTSLTDISTAATGNVITMPFRNENYTDIEIQAPSGGYRINRLELIQTQQNVFGWLDGIYHISGDGAASEDFGNDAESPTNQFLVIQNANRNNIKDFFCLELTP